MKFTTKLYIDIVTHVTRYAKVAQQHHTATTSHLKTWYAKRASLWVRTSWESWMSMYPVNPQKVEWFKASTKTKEFNGCVAPRSSPYSDEAENLELEKCNHKMTLHDVSAHKIKQHCKHKYICARSFSFRFVAPAPFMGLRPPNLLLVA